MLNLAAIVVGLVLGLVTGGSVANLARLKFRWPWLLLVAVVLRYGEVFSPLSRIEGTQYLYVVSLALIVLWTVWHFRLLPGVWLVTAGGLLNLAVVLTNDGRMPVDATLAARHLGGILVQRGHIGQYVVMGPGTHLSLLGDWITVPPFTEAYSPGDLLIGLGIAAVIFFALRRAPSSEVVP